MVFPLAVFPTTSVDLMSIDARDALPYEMAFMKNTLLRGLNGAVAHGTSLSSSDASLKSFLTYVGELCGIILTHIEVDEHFFRETKKRGIILEHVLGPSCVPDLLEVRESIAALKRFIVECLSNPPMYDGQTLLSKLDFAEKLRDAWGAQLDAVNPSRLIPSLDDTEVREMTREIIAYFTSKCDHAFLVPYILSHHDPATSMHWPQTTPQNWAALSQVMPKYAGCWDFAPYIEKVYATIQGL
ncbi:hypothetical protein K488DRAFT_84898 [Vararia minispora EC-137]|uniref:Uncharacterized protein n=1 Tax=Vararia minispora EC-137 TaxID=1314806 RepID=A0ACB8QNZ6_9AGAM|nr:hypothetical protein K488DRAFT_84898 [Vararia minispora EC-137]